MKSFKVLLFFIVLVLFSSFASAVLNDSVRAYYKFDELDSSVIDALGIFNGTATAGVTANADGKINYAKDYNIGNLSIGNIGALGSFSLSAWIKPDNLTTIQRVVASRKSDGSNEYYMEINPAFPGSMSIGIQTSGSAWRSARCSLNITSDGVYHHWVFTRNSTTFTCYVDGVMGVVTFTSVGGDTSGTITTATATFIGSNPTGATNYYGGLIDEVGIWNRTINQSEVTELYNGGVGKQYPFGDVPPSVPVNSVSFKSQVPSNLTDVSLFSDVLNLTFIFRNDSVSYSSPLLNYSLSGGLSCLQFVNGSCVFLNGSSRVLSPDASSLYVPNVTDYSWYLRENNIYPAIYLLNESFFSVNHSVFSMGVNDVFKSKLLGFNESNAFGLAELMVNGSGLARVYLCNNNYTSGNVQTSEWCSEIGSIMSVSFNHSHGASKHNIVPFNIVNSRVNGVGVPITFEMFLVVRRFSGDVYGWYIPNMTRADTTQTSGNNGVTWSSQSYTFDNHVHIYPFENNFFVSYFASGVFNGSVNVSAVVNELVDVVPVAPSPAEITFPVGGEDVSSRFVNFSWLNGSANYPGVNIASYNLSLLNSDLSFNRSINFSSNTSFSYLWDVYSQNLSVGLWFFSLTTKDSLGLSSFDVEFFNLTRNALLTFNAGNGSAILNFSINLTNLNTSEVFTNSTITGQSVFNIVKGDYYSALIDAEGFAFSSVNLSFNQSFNNYTFGLVLSNSVNISVRDLDSNALITQNVTALFTRQSDSLQYSFTFTGGTRLVSGLLPGVYDVVFTSTSPIAYGSSSYIITINDRTTQSLQATLAQSTFDARFYFKSNTDSVIVGASVMLSRLINSSYVVVGSDTTDVTGLVTFNVRDSFSYRFTITADGYTPRVFDMKIYAVNSPYVFFLTPSTTTQFQDIYDYLSYRVLPEAGQLNSSANYTFSLETIATNGSLIFQSINCSGNYSSVSGSPQGATIYVGVDTSGRSSVSCAYFFEYEPPFFNYSVNKSWVGVYHVLPLNQSIVSGADFVKKTTSQYYLTILAYCIIFFACFIAFGWSNGNPYIVSIVMIFGIVGFSVLQWINPIIGGLVAVVGGFLMFMSSRGG